MKNIDEFNSRYLPLGSGIVWPESNAEREVLARTLFGLGFVGAHDYWIVQAESIQNPEGKPLAPAFARESLVRQSLAELTQAEHDAVVELVRIAVHGALFSALVSLDQFPRSELSIQVHDEEASINPVNVAPGAEDLHDSFFEWLEKYSSEAKEIP